MMSYQSSAHLHSYKAINTKRKIYRCTLEECHHSINAQLIVGRRAFCGTCEGEFIVTKDHLRRTNLTCIGCGISPGLKKTEDNPLKQDKVDISDLMKKARESIRV